MSSSALNFHKHFHKKMYFVTYLSASCPSYGKKDVKVGIFYFQKAGFRNKSIVENN